LISDYFNEVLSDALIAAIQARLQENPKAKISILPDWQSALLNPYTLGIALGLIIGKPLGIWLFSFISVKLRISTLPEDLNWKSLLGVSFLGGIGFTMSIFITLLAFSDNNHITNSKLIILVSSLIAGMIGLFYLKSILRQNQ